MRRSQWDDDASAAPVEEIRYGAATTSFGPILVASSDVGIVSVRSGESDDGEDLSLDLETLFPDAALVRHDGDLDDALAQIVRLVEDPRTTIDLPLDLRGTDFQKRVWRAVRKVPYGKTATYFDIARKIGAPKAMRAVGTSCSLCPLAYVIPCHRILRKDGSLANGFLGGPERQRALIDREKARRSARS